VSTLTRPLAQHPTPDTATPRRSSQPSERARIFDNRFADNLFALRTVRKVTRRELAELTGIPHYTIEKIENGHGCGRKGLRRAVTIGEAVVLAEALGVAPGELLKPSVVTR